MKMQQLISSLSIKNVNDKLIKINDFVIIQLFIDDIDAIDKLIIAVFTIEIHLMNDFKTNMLIDVDVLKSQKMFLNFEHNIFIIINCKIKMTINSMNRFKFHIKRIIRNQKNLIVLFDEIIKMSMIFHDELFTNKDFFFEFQCVEYLNHDENVFAHIIDFDLFFVHVNNIIDLSITLSRRARLSFVIEYNQQSCFQIIVNDVLKAVCDWMSQRIMKNFWKIKIIKIAAIIISIYIMTIDNYSFDINFNTNDELLTSSILSLVDVNVNIIDISQIN